MVLSNCNSCYLCLSHSLISYQLYFGFYQSRRCLCFEYLVLHSSLKLKLHLKRPKFALSTLVEFEAIESSHKYSPHAKFTVVRSLANKLTIAFFIRRGRPDVIVLIRLEVFARCFES